MQYYVSYNSRWLAESYCTTVCFLPLFGISLHRNTQQPIPSGISMQRGWIKRGFCTRVRGSENLHSVIALSGMFFSRERERERKHRTSGRKRPATSDDADYLRDPISRPIIPFLLAGGSAEEEKKHRRYFDEFPCEVAGASDRTGLGRVKRDRSPIDRDIAVSNRDFFGNPPVPYRCPSSSIPATGTETFWNGPPHRGGSISPFSETSDVQTVRGLLSPPPPLLLRENCAPPTLPLPHLRNRGIFSELLHTKWLSEDWLVTIEATLALCIHSAPRRHSTTALKNRIGGTGPPVIYRAGSYPAITLTKVGRGRVTFV